MFGVAHHSQLSPWLHSRECHHRLPSASAEKYDVGGCLVFLSHQALHTRIAEGLTVTPLWGLGPVFTIPCGPYPSNLWLFVFISLTWTSSLFRLTFCIAFCINFSFPSPLLSLCYTKKLNTILLMMKSLI